MQRSVRVGVTTLLAALLMAQAEPDEPEAEKEAPTSPTERPSPENPSPAKPGPGADKAIDLGYQLKVWQVVNGSAAKINDCLDRYLAVQAAAKGTVELSLDLSGEGRMVNVGTKSVLPASEKLQQCLKFIAQSWRFPPMEGVEKLSTGLQIKVAKGQKFSLTKPGEAPPPAKGSEPRQEDSGFLGFSPGWSTGFYR